MAKKVDPKKCEAASDQKTCEKIGGAWDKKNKKCIPPDPKKIPRAKNEKECLLAGGKWDPKTKKCAMS